MRAGKLASKEVIDSVTRHHDQHNLILMSINYYLPPSGRMFIWNWNMGRFSKASLNNGCAIGVRMSNPGGVWGGASGHC